MNSRIYETIENHIVSDKEFYILLVISLKIRLIYSVMTDNYYYGGDIFARMEMAYRFNPINTIMTGVDWPPAHVWLLKLFALIFQDYLYAPRLVGIISDSLCSGFIYILGKRMFTRKVGICAAFIHATFYLNVVLSSVTLSGPVFTAMMLGGIILLLEYQEDKKLKKLYLLSIILAYASWIRFEAWPINFFIGLYLIFRKEKMSRIFIYGLITVTPIVGFLFYCYLKTGDPIHFLVFSDYEIKSATDRFNPGFWKYINRAFYMFPSTILSVGVISSLWFLKVKKYRFIHSVILISFFISVYKLVNYTLINDPRYFLLFECWFLFVSFGFVSTIFKDRWRALIIYILIIWTTGIYQTKKYIKDELDWHPIQFSIEQKKIFRYIKSHHNKERRYFVGDGINFIQTAITYNTGIKRRDIKCYSPERFWLGQSLTIEKFRSCLEERDVNTLISFPTHNNDYGHLSKMIDSKEGQELLKKYRFKLVYEVNGYRIHEIQK